MPFVLLPVIDKMIALYQQPRNLERFQQYLKILQGDTRGDIDLPIGTFNPMAGEHALEKLRSLRQWDAEQMITALSECVNGNLEDNILIRVSIGLADDLKGSWTNRYTADFDYKFKIQAMVSRRFCTPVFWTSEPFNRVMIRERILEAMFRFLYALKYPQPRTLGDHVRQEQYVYHKMVHGERKTNAYRDAWHQYYMVHQDSDDYARIFNFFYGDEASAQLGFVQCGIKGIYPGFQYCQETAATALKG